MTERTDNNAYGRPGSPDPNQMDQVAQAAAGTSEQSHAAEGVKTTALAPPGKPDGEVDTRASSTPR